MFHTLRRFLLPALAALVLIGALVSCLPGTGTSAPETAPETLPATSSETLPATEEPTAPATDAPTEPAPVVYYVCNNSADPAGTAFRTYDDPDKAMAMCKRMVQMGYRVISSAGEVIYMPYTELQSDILRESKAITDFVRDQGFKYGDAPLNPAMNYRAKKVSCDRFVCWALYNVGFTDQPRTQGVVVSNMAAWCEANGFERIDREEDLQPGDVVLVNYNGSWPAHTFLYAGEAGGGQSYRYDCGSDTRIQSTQPSKEPLYQFWRAYRPVADSPHREAEGEFKKLPLG